ncbi:MAG: NERD domain-containing protein [Gammaproteobacteria bacterium]|jgi:hypothetical protein|nr:NERD domain-containing protein [Gammaproteobacteria bacterium]MDP6616523.1 NERD domain-containing protein [Gammaproteobacteria bacterium]MDP6694228.1 NERD domain-containing protein [Gammaproteobacteria bacterium]MDP7041095.1 NERD domain-containing protein [Gammaproteobacteria bacterium]
MPLDPTTIGLAVAAVVLAVTLVLLVGKRKGADPAVRFRRASKAFLSHFLIPDGEGGEIHIEYAMLCPRGIVIVDVKDVVGNVFGSDGMEEWAVITGEKRFTFSNPQPGLYDRTAAVKRMVPDVPVIGYVAFTSTADFSKGSPKHVVGLDKLVGELEAEHAQQSAAPDAYWPSWELLRSAATGKQVGELVGN